MYNTNMILSAAKNGAADFSKIKTMINDLKDIVKDFDPEYKVDNEILGDLRYYLKAKFVLGNNQYIAVTTKIGNMDVVNIIKNNEIVLSKLGNDRKILVEFVNDQYLKMIKEGKIPNSNPDVKITKDEEDF